MSVIDKNGRYVGGAILPGLRVSLDSMSASTAQLPRISLDTPRRVIGKNTIDCMRSGVIFGNAAMIDGMLDRIEEELGENFHHRHRRHLQDCPAALFAYDHV